MSRIVPGVCLLALAVFLACGGSSLDQEGLAGNSSAQEQFTRASQLYFRGRLTASLEEFNGVIYRYPDSPLAGDARLAVRRVESDLSGEDIHETPENNYPAFTSRIAVVGVPGVTSSISSAAELLRGTGASVAEITDHQAPELTVVFHASGFEEEADAVADSLERWLARPETLSARPGEELIEAVASGYDVLVIIGSDAVFESFAN